MMAIESEWHPAAFRSDHALSGYLVSSGRFGLQMVAIAGAADV